MPVLILIWILGSLTIPTDTRASQERVFGLESVKLERVFDPDPMVEQFRLVSGSLKLTGSNVWEAVTYIPQRTAAPRTDRGVFRASGRTYLFYSFLTFATSQGMLSDDGQTLTIVKVNREGRQQTEVWYVGR